MRIDKFLWFVRLYKTRTDATDAVRNNRVLMENQPVKASREVEVGQTFSLKRPPALLTYRIKGFPKGRVGAKLVPDYLEDLTPHEELDRLTRLELASTPQRDRGAGRPTKRDRRALDNLMRNAPEEA